MAKKAAKKKKIQTKYDSAPQKGEMEVGKDRIDRTIRKRTFEYYENPTVGVEFFLFRNIGDEITGQIIGHAITNIRRNSSYPIKLPSGKVVEIFANKQMHGIIRDFELIRSHIRIVYIGRDHNPFGHASKVHRFYKIDPGTGHETGPLVQHLKSLKKKRSKKNA